MNQKYLKLLSKEYPTIDAACNEIINLNAIKCLPKGTEYFFSDLHGEYEAFLHLLKSASGIIRSKIEDIFDNSVSEEERSQLAALIYNPEAGLANVTLKEKELDDWKKITIFRLVQVCKEVSSKYTRSKVRKKIPEDFSYILDELLSGDHSDIDKKRYYSEIIHSIITVGMGDKFIIAMSHLIQNLSIDILHIIGDIYDRGPRADIIMNELMHFHDIDIQWGNHDIYWMGAVSGSLACIANVIRMGISYNNFDLLEDGYGINLRALSMFAVDTYRDDPCTNFIPHVLDENKYDPVDVNLAAKMHKAITIIQFKLEGQLIKRHPEYHMDDRILLDKIDFETGAISLSNKQYMLTDKLFPTIDKESPLTLTPAEEELMNTIASSFYHSDLLNKHVRFLYSHGSMYKCINSNLLYHGCIPMRSDGTFDEVMVDGKTFKGKALLDYIDAKVHNGYFMPKGSKERENVNDFIWYLWCGAKSPLFGKSKLSAFEHYFIKEKETHKEEMNAYYQLSHKEEVCDMILKEFNLTGESCHIINGHVPVKIKEGESPVKANGKLFIIDGGISKAYQSKTGIAGYTLIYNSRHLNLAEHKPFQSNTDGILNENTPKVTSVEVKYKRVTVADTDLGCTLTEKINDLCELVAAYREGVIKENIQLK